jgi:hypothetical protein
MTQAVGCRFLSAEFRVQAQVSAYWICGGQNGTGGRFLSEYLGFSLSVSCQQCSIQIFIYMLLLSEGQNTEAGNLPKSNAVSEIRVKFKAKYFHLVFKMSI